ncbi:MAG TPA: hypothetical protein VHP83_09250, partial [Aggregatilineaceae bacterium]|nr:hypothetical protein [Aggregatilineaceae bacterium]
AQQYLTHSPGGAIIPPRWSPPLRRAWHLWYLLGCGVAAVTFSLWTRREMNGSAFAIRSHKKTHSRAK